MDNIRDIVVDYVSQNNTNYALMIKGEWGCGKTYYLKNVLKPAIEVIVANPKKELKYRLIYISLYGLSSFEDLHKRIFLEIYPIINIKNKKLKMFSNLTSRLVVAASELFQVSSLFKKLDYEQFYDLGNYVLCFDDLERISNKINVEDMLGFINDFVEHDGVKTLIIANENEINNSDKYNKIKEKLIGRTLEFDSDINSLYNDLIIRFKDEYEIYYNFLVSSKEYILSLFASSKKNNLRSLIFAIESYRKIFYCFYELKENKTIKENKKYEKSILTLSIGLFLEFKKGMNLDLSQIDAYTIYSDYSYRTEEPERAEDINLLTPRKLYELYFLGTRIEYDFLRSIYDYTISGYLDVGNLKKEITDNLKEFPEYIQSRDKLNMFYFLEDDEFLNTMDKVLKFIEAGEYTLSDYLPIYVRINWFIKDSLYSKVSVDEFRDIILKGVRSREKKDKYYLDLDREFSDYITSDDPNIKILIEEMAKVNNRNYVEENNQKIQEIESWLKSDFDRFTDSLTNQYASFPIIKFLDPKTLYDSLMKQTNIHIYLFYLEIGKRYTKYNFPNVKKVENDNLLKLKELLDSQIKIMQPSIKRTHLQKISGEIDIIAKMKVN